ncbi:MAG: steroid 3-ketoacyl-CoA thiolase, partial [Solirubrobacterales bacterium]
MSLNPEDVVIVEAARTAVGRGHPEKGDFRNTHANEMLGAVYESIIERAGIEAGEVDETITGCVQQFGEQSLNVGRTAWLQAGLPLETAGTTIDFQCGSSQQAVNMASGLVGSGARELVIGAGVEHMGHVPMGVGTGLWDKTGTPFPEPLMDRYALVSQGISAGMIARKWDIPREELDDWALKSHQNA